MESSTTPDTGTQRSKVAATFWWGLFALAAVGAIVAAVYWKPTKRLPVLRDVPGFEFTDQQGETFGSDDLEEKVWVASFIFTRCRNACPGMTGEMQRVQTAVDRDPALRDRVRLVCFSVDPAHDTPEKLAEFADRYGADVELWRFLTGGRDRIVALCERGFGLNAGSAIGSPKASSSPPHSDRFSVVDGEGRVRGTYRPTASEEDFQLLIGDLEVLVRELE